MTRKRVNLQSEKLSRKWGKKAPLGVWVSVKKEGKLREAHPNFWGNFLTKKGCKTFSKEWGERERKTRMFVKIMGGNSKGATLENCQGILRKKKQE